MNNTCAVLWYDKQVKDTLLEIQVFTSEEEAREFLKGSQTDRDEYYPKIVPNINVFVQDERGYLIKQ